MSKQVLLISNEIERIIDTLERNSGYTGGIGDIQRAICDKILSFINSLPEEDERIDLEKEINKFLDDTLLQNKIKDNAIQVYKEEFSFERNAKKAFNILEKACSDYNVNEE